MSIIQGANVALRFLLELCLLAALGYWGFKTGSTAIAKLALGLGSPLLAATLWGLFVAPRSNMQLAEPLRLALEVVLFGCAAAVLYATGQPHLARGLVLVAAINRILMYLWGQ